MPRPEFPADICGLNFKTVLFAQGLVPALEVFPGPATGCRHCSKRNIYLWRRCDRPAPGDVVGQNDVSFAVTFEVCGVHSVSADTDRGPRRQRRLPPRPQLSPAARLARLSVPTALPRATHSLKPSLRSASGLLP